MGPALRWVMGTIGFEVVFGVVNEIVVEEKHESCNEDREVYVYVHSVDVESVSPSYCHDVVVSKYWGEFCSRGSCSLSGLRKLP